MAYILNKSDGSVLLTLQDGDLDTSTSIGLLGRNFTGYGEIQNENFIFLLENFANVNPPARAIKGQTWFNSADSILNVYTGDEWIPVGSATPSVSPPPEVIGSFWLKTTTNQLFVFTNTGWELVGPQGVEGFAKTRAESSILKDTNDINRPVILFYVNGVVEAICSDSSFTINLSNSVPGFLNLLKGINISSLSVVQGNLIGNSSTTTKLQTPRTINSVNFDGSSNITIKSDTNNFLKIGDYLVGNNFNGSTETVWSVDASSDNIIGTVVARNSNGSFSAQEITAVSFNGALVGNVNATTGSSFISRLVSPVIEGQTYTGNAASATRLNPGRLINGVRFDGSQDVIITAAAETLSGSTINSTVINSSLRTVGTLSRLSVEDAGIDVGQGNKVKISSNDSKPKIAGDTSLEIAVDDGPSIRLVRPAEALQNGAPNLPAILSFEPSTNIGGPNNKFNEVFANTFVGNANSATRLQSIRTINNIPFNGTQNITIPAENVNKTLTVGNYLTGNNFNGSTATTWAVDASELNVANKVVARNAQGNFSAGVISATLEGNSSTTTRLQTARTINSVAFDGTADIVIKSNTNNSISTGSYIIGSSFDGSVPRTWSVDATPSAISGKVVARDNQGNFSANNITASLLGNATTATRLQTARTINGVPFDGTRNISIPATEFGKVKAFVVLGSGRGSLPIVNSFNVISVSLSGGTYSVNFVPGTFSNGNYVVLGTASDTDHFVVYNSSNANQARVNTVDNGSGNNRTQATSGRVLLAFVER
jgi:hypothetical protein